MRQFSITGPAPDYKDTHRHSIKPYQLENVKTKPKSISARQAASEARRLPNDRLSLRRFSWET